MSASDMLRKLREQNEQLERELFREYFKDEPAVSTVEIIPTDGIEVSFEEIAKTSEEEDEDYHFVLPLIKINGRFTIGTMGAR